MNLPEGTHLAYVRLRPAHLIEPLAVAELAVEAADDCEPGAAWEFLVTEWHDHKGGAHVRVQVHEDAFAAFTQLPEFFTALSAMESPTAQAVQNVLEGLGAKDETRRP